MAQPLYAVSGTGATYLYLFDQYWWIANRDTLTRIFGADPEIVSVDQLPEGAQLGPQIAPQSFLFLPGTDTNLYFMCAGNWTAYNVTSTEAQDYFQFNGPAVSGVGSAISNWLMTVVQQGTSIFVPANTEALAAG